MNLQYCSRTVLFICLLLVPWAIRMGIVQCVSTSVRPLISKKVKVIRRTVPYRTYVCLIAFDPDASLGNNSKYGPSMYHLILNSLRIGIGGQQPVSVSVQFLYSTKPADLIFKPYSNEHPAPRLEPHYLFSFHLTSLLRSLQPNYHNHDGGGQNEHFYEQPSSPGGS